MKLKERIKRIRSHSGIAQFLAECDPEPVREISTLISGPYAFSSTQSVWRWNGIEVVWAETKHRVYDVYSIEE